MEPERRRRHVISAAGLTRAAPANNHAHRLIARALLVLLAGDLGAGCSMSIPLSGVETDATPTGSIDRTAAVLSPAFDREDLRRAKAALAIALDPQGNGARVAWQNPQSGAHGAFAASAPPFADQDRVCRAFTGEASPGDAVARKVSGSACRDGDGTWQIRGGGGAKA